MSFNVSRFLVRVRQFWTRDRLVPVLGITALFLFLLNFHTYLNSLFEKRPIVAFHALGNGEGFRLHTNDQEHVFVFRHEHDQHWERHREELERHRDRLERHREELERHRERLHRKIRIRQGENGHEIHVDEDGTVKEYVIENSDEESDDVRIEVNGRRVEIDGVEIEI